jgi:hypothetical protein
MFKTLTATSLLLAGVLAADEISPKLSLQEMPEPTLGADSMVKAGVPKGKVTDFVFSDSKVFEGTKRRIHLYIPAQYDPKKETAVMVFQDGHTYVNPKGEFRVTTVFDNLIAAGDMPPATRGIRNRSLRGKTTTAASSMTRSPPITRPFSSMKSCRWLARTTT